MLSLEPRDLAAKPRQLSMLRFHLAKAGKEIMLDSQKTPLPIALTLHIHAQIFHRTTSVWQAFGKVKDLKEVVGIQMSYIAAPQNSRLRELRNGMKRPTR